MFKILCNIYARRGHIYDAFEYFDSFSHSGQIILRNKSKSKGY